MYSASAEVRCEWKMNLLGEKNKLQYKHLIHFARLELYLEGRNAPRQPPFLKINVKEGIFK